MWCNMSFFLPRFSIIIPNWQGSTTDDKWIRGIKQVITAANHLSSWDMSGRAASDLVEILCYHNGPLIRPQIKEQLLQVGVEVRTTDKFVSDWGFAQRDRGIKEATGHYILHFNSDNELLPCALQMISKRIDMEITDGKGCTPAMVVFGIITTTRGQRHLLTGDPPVCHRIDAMQAVVRREHWIANGGWVERSQVSDGIQLERLAKKHGYVVMTEVLGEHH